MSQMMLDHLSTQIGSSGCGSVVGIVCQRFLETFFASFFAANAVDAHMDLPTEEALKVSFVLEACLFTQFAPAERRAHHLES